MVISPSVSQPTRIRYLVVAAGCSLALVAYIHRLGFSLFLPEIKRDFGLTDQDAGNLTWVFLIAYGAGQLPGGLAGDRWGARLLLPLFVLGWSLVTAAIALVPATVPASEEHLTLLLSPLLILLILRGLFGALQSGAFPVFSRVVTDWLPVTERASAQGIMWTASRLGPALIPFFQVWLLNVCGGWRIPFEILAGVGLLWAAAFWYWFRNRPEEAAQVNAAERELIRAGQPPPAGASATSPWRAMLRSRSVWFLCLMYGCCGPAGNFMFTLLALYLRDKDHRNLPDDTSQWLLGLPFATGFVACALGGLWSDWLIRRWSSRKWGRRVNGLVGLTLAGLGFAAIALVENVWLLGVVLCALQFGNDFCMGPAWAASTEIGQRHAGTLSATMNLTSNITGAIGAGVAGALLYGGKAELIFFIYGGIYVLGALCWLGIDVTKPMAASER